VKIGQNQEKIASDRLSEKIMELKAILSENYANALNEIFSLISFYI